MAKNRITFSDDFVLKNEKVGIGTTDPSATLTVVGDTNITGTVNAASYTGDIVLNSIYSTVTGIVTLTNNIPNQVIDNFTDTDILSAKYQVSVACTGQLAGSYESPSELSVGSITGGQFYIPGTYYNVRLYTQNGVGTDARANIRVDGTAATIGITSTYNTLVTTAAHGLGTNQPVSFASSITRAEYVTLVDNDTFYTPVAHGIGSSEAIYFQNNVGSAVTANVGNIYYATGTGSTTFILEYDIGGGPITGIPVTTFIAPGNKVTFGDFSIAAGTIYYATGTGTTTFTLATQSTGIGAVVGIAISTGLSNTLTISGGVSSVEIVHPGSGYNVGAALTVLNTSLNSVVGSGFQIPVTNVYTNYQTTDILVLTNNSSVGIKTCDYMEYATLANNDILGVFDASLNGSTAQLRFSPIYKDNNIRFVRTSILK